MLVAEGRAAGGPLKQATANARLIAAAPDLLTALQALGARPVGYCFCRTPEQAERGHTGECREACAAIAKATGK